MKKIFAKIHLWLSVPLGIVVTIVCLSGAVLVFESEITRALHQNLYSVKAPAGAQPLSPSQLVARIGEQMPDSLHIVSLQLSADNNETCMASFRETGRGQLSIDPYTGRVNGWTESTAFFLTMRRIHRWLLDPPASKGGKSMGKVVVGISTMGLVLIIVSGLVLWVPRNRKALRNRLRVSSDCGLHRFWYDCHVSLGFYAAILLSVMALTGLTWSFGWYRTAAYAIFGGAQRSVALQENIPRKDGSGHDGRVAGSVHGGVRNRVDAHTFDYAVWDEVLAQLVLHYPAYSTIALTMTEAQVGRHSYMRRVDTVVFDPLSGRIVEITRYEDTPVQQRLRGWFYALHTGSWGGKWTKVLYLIVALIGASLPLTGYYLWYKRNGRRLANR